MALKRFNQNFVADKKERNKIIRDLMGRCKPLMGYVRGLVRFCKTF